jgi:hypothetical protein
MTPLRKPYSHLDLKPSTLLSVRLNEFFTGISTTVSAFFFIPQRLNIFGLPISLHLLYYKKVKTLSDYKGAFENLLLHWREQEWDVGTRITGCIRLSSSHFFIITSVALFYLKRIPIAFIIFFSRQTFIEDGGYCSISLCSSDTIHHHL